MTKPAFTPKTLQRDMQKLADLAKRPAVRKPAVSPPPPPPKKGTRK